MDYDRRLLLLSVDGAAPSSIPIPAGWTALPNLWIGSDQRAAVFTLLSYKYEPSKQILSNGAAVAVGEQGSSAACIDCDVPLHASVSLLSAHCCCCCLCSHAQLPHPHRPRRPQRRRTQRSARRRPMVSTATGQAAICMWSDSPLDGRSSHSLCLSNCICRPVVRVCLALLCGLRISNDSCGSAESAGARVPGRVRNEGGARSAHNPIDSRGGAHRRSGDAAHGSARSIIHARVHCASCSVVDCRELTTRSIALRCS